VKDAGTKSVILPHLDVFVIVVAVVAEVEVVDDVLVRDVIVDAPVVLPLCSPEEVEDAVDVLGHW
jgi:hypothetical protein